MRKDKNEARLYIKDAKKRLMGQEYSENMRELCEVYYLNNKRVTQRELRQLNIRVEEILASEEFILDPLSKLILDRDAFQRMDETEKTKYMLELSEVYASIKRKMTS